eukprot:TRINITY_DN4553_c0_g2_i1.p1 TRINITY_DN4553_c0_g2~~TRINITY_DN4553_c0_g2_i1.p1  ORF type:complete len:375 (+),score=155.92 TRINITY_DN4553_c0_g2_i1:85-1209(+)
MGCNQSSTVSTPVQPAPMSSTKTAPPRAAERRRSSAQAAAVRIPLPAKAAPSAGAITFTVQQLTGVRSEITLDASARITEVKQEAERLTGVPAVQQRLVFSGRQLDDVRTLSHYGVHDGAVLHLAVRKLKGVQKPGLQEMLDTYEITLAQGEDLRVLALYDIVFLIDDSGSMNRVEVTAGVKQSRWQELRDTVAALVEFATYFDDDGTDIYFLNRDGVEGVTDSDDPRLAAAFAARPTGTTPLASRLQEVVAEHAGEKPLLVVLATDGEPDAGVSNFVHTCRDLLSGRGGRDVRLAVMACTQDERSVQWLNQLDDDPLVGHKIDVCDDYESEREEVLAAGVPRFLISDYYVKALLGPILAKYDNLDGSQLARAP